MTRIPMTRNRQTAARCFLVPVLVILSAILFAEGTTARAETPDRPNLIYIMADDKY